MEERTGSEQRTEEDEDEKQVNAVLSQRNEVQQQEIENDADQVVVEDVLRNSAMVPSEVMEPFFFPHQIQSDAKRDGGDEVVSPAHPAQVEKPSTKPKRKELTFVEKMVLRDSIQMAICVALAFLKPLQLYLQQNVALTAIYSIVCTLRPFSNSSVGHSMDYLVWYILFGFFAPAFSLLVAVIAPHSPGFFLLTYFVLITLVNVLSQWYRRIMVAGAILSINLGALQSVYYYLLNFSGLPADEQWTYIMIETRTMVIAYFIPMTVYGICSLTIFPWSHKASCITSMENQWVHAINLLKGASQAFQVISAHYQGLDTSGELSALSTDKLKGEISKCLSSLRAVQGNVFSASLESRFQLNGDGQELFENFNATKPCDILLRKLAQNIVDHIEFLHVHPNQVPWSNDDTTLPQDDSHDENLTFEDASLPEKTDQQQAAHNEEELPNQANEMAKRNAKRKKSFQNLSVVSVKMVHSLLVIFELASLVLSKPSREVEDIDTIWAKIRAEDETLERFHTELRHTAKQWNQDLDYDSPVTVFMTLHVKLLASLSRTLREGLERKHVWCESPLPRSWQHRTADLRATFFHLSSSRTKSFEKGPFVGLQTSSLTWYQRLYRDLSFHLSTNQLRIGFKVGLATTLVFLFAFIPSTQAAFHSVSMSNAISTSLSALRQVQLGLVIERVGIRVVGILCGYIFAGVAFEIACAIEPDKCLVLDGWLFYLLGFAFFALYFFTKSKYPRFAYGAYSIVKEYFVISILVISTSYADPNSAAAMRTKNISSDSNLAKSAWYIGGFITLCSLAGGVIAVLVGTFIFPITGSGSIRRMLSDAFQHFIFLIEGNIYSTHLNRASLTSTADCTLVQQDLIALEARLNDVEAYLSDRINLEAPGFLSAVKMEPLQLRHSANPQTTSNAVDATKAIFHQLWVIRRLVRDPVYHRHLPVHDPQAIRLTNMQISYSKMLSAVLFELSAALRGTTFLHATPPSLRNTVSNPTLLKRLIRFHREKVVNNISPHPSFDTFRQLEDNDEEEDMTPFITGDLAVFAFLYEAISVHLETVLHYTDNLMPSPPYAAALQSIDAENTQAYLDLLSKGL